MRVGNVIERYGLEARREAKQFDASADEKHTQGRRPEWSGAMQARPLGFVVYPDVAIA